MKRFLLMLFCLILNVSSVFAFEGNKKLYNMKIGDVVGSYIHYYPNGFDEITTSYSDPEKPRVPAYHDDLDEIEVYKRIYSPQYILDTYIESAWKDGVEGDGIGEVVIIPCDFLDCTKKIEIFTGFARTKDLWFENNRPRNIKLFILKSERIIPNPNLYTIDTDYICEDITVIDEQYATLKDVYNWQEISIDKSKLPTNDRLEERLKECKMSRKTDPSLVDNFICSKYHSNYYYFLGIQILSVYEGTKYQDTCISEVRFEY